MGCFTLLTLLCVMLQVFQASSKCTGGVPWTVSWAPKPRNDLRCHTSARCSNTPTVVESEEFDKCCACRSCATWEGNEIDLFIEYISVFGKSLVIPDQAHVKNHDEVYKIDRTDSEMSEIPSNLCNWDEDSFIKDKYHNEYETIKPFLEKIVKIDFRNNKIRKLENINCLIRLDDLNLRNNRLTHISNTSFPDLSYLRYIDFSGNFIKRVDANVLSSPNLNIFRADFTHNLMDKLDVSNMMSRFPFCDIDFGTNKIKELVNECNFTLNMSASYGPGFVHFSDNQIETFPDFKKLLNLESIAQMGKLLSFGIDFRDIPIICDCNLESFMSQSANVIKTLWRDYMNVTCTGPEDLEGIPVGNVDPARFVCEKEPSPSCPLPYCKCIDKPNANTLYVDCSYNMDNHLDYLPPLNMSERSNFISLNFSGQQLTNITNLTKLANINMLDLSGNDLTEISTEVAQVLENTTWVDLSDNYDLHELPKAFLQYRNICSTNMRNLQIYCNCESAWIKSWVQSKSCINEDNMFTCILPNNERVRPQDFEPDDLGCFQKTQYTKELIISGLIAFLIITGTFVYTFRYEILILLVRVKQLAKSSKVTKFKYDVFLSFNNEDEDVLKWINSFQKVLTKERYKVYLPIRDLPFGSERDTEILSTINQSRNFVTLLTGNYLEQAEQGTRSWTENEWKYGWHNFLRDRYKNIVLINLDHVSSFDIDHSQIKAFLRVGCVVDFNNHDRKIMEHIFKILGKPYIPPTVNGKALENEKPIFQPNMIYNPGENKEHDLIKEQDFQQPIDKNISYTETEEVVPPFIRPKYKEIKNKKFQPPERFACYYEEPKLQKTPNIPLFKTKDPAKTGQPLNPTSLHCHKMEDLLKRYEAKNPDNNRKNKHTKTADRFNVNLSNEIMKRPTVELLYSSDDESNDELQDSQSESWSEISIDGAEGRNRSRTDSTREHSQVSINLSLGSRTLTDVSV